MPQKFQTTADDGTDLVWGAKAIGKIISRTASQVRYLYSIGFFDQDTVWKASHKILIGSRRRLEAGDGFRRLPSPDQPTAA
jgi:hypothetical protein